LETENIPKFLSASIRSRITPSITFVSVSVLPMPLPLLLGPTLRRGWTCTSAFPLCLHKHAMGWPLPLLSLLSTLTPTRIYWQILLPSNVV